MHISRSVYFVQSAPDVFYRAAGIKIIWPRLVTVTALGLICLAFALFRLGIMLERFA